VNALSEKLEVWVVPRRQAPSHGVRAGETTKKLEVIGKAKGTGTTVCHARHEDLHGDALDYATVATRLRELAFLNKALTITLKDERRDSRKRRRSSNKGGSPSS